MPTPSKKTLGRVKRELGPADIDRYVDEYLNQDKMAKQMAKEADSMKQTIVAYLKAHGEPDDRGSLWVEAGTHRLKHERRISKTLDEAKASTWLRRRHLLDQCQKTVVVFDEDEMLGLAHDGKIPDDVLEGFYDTREVFAFKVVTE